MDYGTFKIDCGTFKIDYGTFKNDLSHIMSEYLTTL